MLLENVKKLCESKGITVAQLERDICLSNGSIRKWDESIPSVDKLAKVADHFNVSTDYLIGRNEISLSADSKIIAVTFDALAASKQDLVKRYINMLQAE